MAIELKTKYLNYYKDLANAMVNENSIYTKMLDKLTEELHKFGVDNETVSDKITTVVAQIIPEFEKLAEDSARKLIELESEIPLKENNASESLRKIQYYDDRLLETVMEKQADLASFATNANADSAQTTINDLKEKMSALEGRVTAVGTPPSTTPIIPIPSGLSITGATTDTLSIAWSPVVEANTYILYQDGVIISTTGNTSVVATGLVASTKYSYAVRASNGTISSDLSLSIIGTTTA